MYHHKLAMVNGQLHRRSRHGEVRSEPLPRHVKWGDEIKKIEGLYWEVMTGEILGTQWLVKRIDPDQGVRLDNLVKVMRFTGVFTKDFARSHYDYVPETGKLTRRYKEQEALPKAGLSLGGERFPPHQLVWLLMKGEIMRRGERVYFIDGDKENLKWENIAVDRRQTLRNEIIHPSVYGLDGPDIATVVV